ncbi:RNA polymerase sigma factor SigJ [Pseudosulfitobacter pseudonitzschiae]|nr:RNA polymerase sigma factor SigJ [Pseudosulfitobacter pseudonitzschiae]MCD2313648.1 RNA polymerase sigma factor SigJ [Pseudosulfitobacter pseudonitzschiae]
MAETRRVGSDPMTDPAHIFDSARPGLVKLAYRMLGSVADAEDVVQTAFLRWQAVDPASVQSPPAYLRRIVTRLCLDLHRTTARRREVYLGEWLPDPVVTDPSEDITLMLMLALERLSPLERAAFLLHDVFGVPFEEVSGIIDRTPAAARQLAARARQNVQQDNARFSVDATRGQQIAAAFFAASRAGDMGALRRLLAEDISLHADGGGQRPTVIQPVLGRDAVVQAHAGFADHFRDNGSTLIALTHINGLPGCISRESDGQLQTTALDIENGLIRAIYVTRNPDKLRHLKASDAMPKRH